MRYLTQTRFFTLKKCTYIPRFTGTAYILRHCYHNNTPVEFGEGQSANNATISDWQYHLDSTVVSDPRTVSITRPIFYEILSIECLV